ncbi:MAG: DUF1028 domain-containing protein [Chloroflexota bacterium]
MTFSIVAHDPVTGQLGGAVASRFLAVGGLVLYARADVGVVATQALANLAWGPRGLDLLAAGASPAQALDVLITTDELPERRQAGLIDAQGRVAAHTGSGCMTWAGHLPGDRFTCQGNILASGAVLDAVAEVMRTRGDLPLADRLVAALAAGQAAGGDRRGQQSAGVLVVQRGGGYGGGSDRLVDLRVDDHPTPVDELARLLRVRSLLFDKPAEADLRPIDPALASELADRLDRLGFGPADAGDLDGLWARLERWAGRENLEERMVRPGSIDVTVLGVLRDQSGG